MEWISRYHEMYLFGKLSLKLTFIFGFSLCIIESRSGIPGIPGTAFSKPCWLLMLTSSIGIPGGSVVEGLKKGIMQIWIFNEPF